MDPTSTATDILKSGSGDLSATEPHLRPGIDVLAKQKPPIFAEGSCACHLVIDGKFSDVDHVRNLPILPRTKQKHGAYHPEETRAKLNPPPRTGLLVRADFEVLNFTEVVHPDIHDFELVPHRLAGVAFVAQEYDEHSLLQVRAFGQLHRGYGAVLERHIVKFHPIMKIRSSGRKLRRFLDRQARFRCSLAGLFVRRVMRKLASFGLSMQKPQSE